MFSNVYRKIDYRRTINILKDKKNILDIGCGEGVFLSLLNNNRVKKIYGLDISKHAIARAKQRLPSGKFIIGKLDKDCFGKDKFDAITCFHVLEHLGNPKQKLNIMYELLNQKGILVLRVPNIKSWEAQKTGKNWFHFDYPYHVNHFSPKSLKTILKKCGFKGIYFKYDLWEYKQTFLYSLLYIVGLKNNTLITKIVLLPLQIIFMPLALILSKFFKDGSTMEIVAYKD